MKKLFATLLASAMVLAMAPAAFAADLVPADLTMSAQGYLENNGVVKSDRALAPDTAYSKAGYGKTVYYPLFVASTGTKAVDSVDQVKGVSAKPSWTQGKERVDKISIVKKRVDSNTAIFSTAVDYAYFVGIKFKADPGNLSTNDVYGKIELSKGNKNAVNVFVTLGYTSAKLGYTITETPDNAANPTKYTYAFGTMTVPNALTDTDTLYNFTEMATIPSMSSAANVSADATDAKKLLAKAATKAAIDSALTTVDLTKLDMDEEDEIELFGGAGTFTVDTRGQGKIILSNTVEVEKRKELEAMYPDCVFSFVNGNGASFNKIGTLKLSASEGDVLYAVGADGLTLTKLNVPYDSYEEAFVVKTRTLGTYAIADGEIALKAPVVEAPASSVPSVEPVNPTVPGNPTTGAIA